MTKNWYILSFPILFKTFLKLSLKVCVYISEGIFIIHKTFVVHLCFLRASRHLPQKAKCSNVLYIKSMLTVYMCLGPLPDLSYPMGYELSL